MSNGQTDLDRAVGDQPEDLVRKVRPGEFSGAEDSAMDAPHRGGGTHNATETMKPFKLGGM